MNITSHSSLLWKTTTCPPVLLNQQLTMPFKMPCKPWEKRRQRWTPRWAPDWQQIYMKLVEVHNIFWLALDLGSSCCTTSEESARTRPNTWQRTGFDQTCRLLIMSSCHHCIKSTLNYQFSVNWRKNMSHLSSGASFCPFEINNICQPFHTSNYWRWQLLQPLQSH